MAKFLISFIFIILNIHLTSQNLSIIQYPDHEALDFSQPFQYTISDFGKIPYSASTVAPLVLSNPIEACSELKHHKNALLQDSEYFKSPPILLVERGTCKFVEKVLNAQNAGYKMVIVMDNVDENLLYMGEAKNEGDAIHIPAVFITEQEGSQLLDAISIQNQLEEYKEILVQIDFPYTQALGGDKSEVKFFLDLPNEQNYNLLFKFFLQFFMYDLEDEIEFAPYYQIFNPESFKYIMSQDQEFNEENDCYNDYYCTIDQDGIEPGTGSQLVEEYLYQICIFKQYGLRQWKDYIRLQFESCKMIASYKICRQNLYFQLQIEEEKLQDCVKFDENGKNDVLDEQIDGFYQNFPFYQYPTIHINNSLYLGSRDGFDVLEAVCASNQFLTINCQKLINDFSYKFENQQVEKYLKFLENEELQYVEDGTQN